MVAGLLVFFDRTYILNGCEHDGVAVSVVQLAGRSSSAARSMPCWPPPGMRWWRSWAAALDLVIADANRPSEVLARFPGVPVLGFGRHTDPQLLRAARQAGFAKVVARSVLSERLPELVEELVR